jgi:transcription elongation GreA/GreB family factor
LGYRKGDVVEWEVPGGKKKFLIKDIIYQPEANGDLLA